MRLIEKSIFELWPPKQRCQRRGGMVRGELRVRIIRSRKTTSRMVPPASASQDRERLSRQNFVASLRLRIKTLEEKNRELTELLERAYGLIAKT
jgi:hypothetical protein